MADIDEIFARCLENHMKYSHTGDREGDVRFIALALAGEAGELANYVKKRWRERDSTLYETETWHEVADVTAYAMMLAAVLGKTPQDLVEVIAHKLRVTADKLDRMKAEKEEAA